MTEICVEADYDGDAKAFGTNSFTNGQALAICSIDTSSVNPFTIDSISVEVTAVYNSSTGYIKFAAYSDDSGVPDQLLATSDELSFTTTGDKSISMNSHSAIAADKIWLALMSKNTDSDGTEFRATDRNMGAGISTAQVYANQNNYANWPQDPASASPSGSGTDQFPIFSIVKMCATVSPGGSTGGTLLPPPPAMVRL